VDNNFIQTVAFAGSLSRTAEVNSRGLQHFAMQLSHVRPEVRMQFAEIAGDVAQKAETTQATAKAPTTELAKRAEWEMDR
jgi:hypothetical protein